MVTLYSLPELHQLELTGGYTQPVSPIERLLAHYDPISLAEMENVKLLNRTDTKYIMRVSQLEQALEHLADRYRVLETANTRLNHYQTLYFDTQDFALYRQHHNHLRSRYKVRVREYLDSQLAFWEVKHKTNQNRTIKSRLQAPEMVSAMSSDQIDDFLQAHAPLELQDLEPKLWNKFQRITLVSKHREERLTLDLNLEFAWGDAYTDLPGIAIAEVKQTNQSQQSDFIQEMRRMSVRPARFSKYCAGVYMLYDDVKINDFKPRIRLVDKLMHEEWAQSSMLYAREAAYV